ncbi:hypothetical protein [Yersinia rohdei]|uniref:hypothetical protein n=1 Tax=Yersinia rohdei TaxID=29485 RepID=UPI00119EEED2|nr:hypothetical protein [Yersinia rohdei]
MLFDGIREWGNSIVGKQLKCVRGLIHILDVEDIEHPQQLLLIFEGGEGRVISCASDGSTLLLRDVAMVESDLGEYGKQVIKDISEMDSFSEIIGKELHSLSAVYSKSEECMIGLNFYFSGCGSINILNLGDEISIYKKIPEGILYEEGISFIPICP